LVVSSNNYLCETLWELLNSVGETIDVALNFGGDFDGVKSGIPMALNFRAKAGRLIVRFGIARERLSAGARPHRPGGDDALRRRSDAAR